MFGNLLKSIGRISPIKFNGGKISLGMPKASLMDVFNVGSAVGTGSPFNISKWALGNVGKNLGLSELMKKGLTLQTAPQWLGIAQDIQSALSLSKGAPSQTGGINLSDPLAAQLAMLQKIMPLAEKDLAFMGEMQGKRQDTARQVINDLDPAYNAQRATKLGNSAATAAMTSADQESRRLSSMGYSQALTGAVRGEAVNRGVDARNNYLEQAMDPATTAEQRRAQLAVMDDATLTQNLDRALGLLDARRNAQLQERAYKSQQPSWMSIVAQLGGNYLSGMGGSDWEKLLRQLGIKSPASQLDQTTMTNAQWATNPTSMLGMGALSNPNVLKALFSRLGYG